MQPVENGFSELRQIRQTRLLIYPFVLFFGLSVSFSLSSYAAASRIKPNLLLVTVDTLRTDRLSCYGFDHVKTPNIDSLAEKSVLFTRAFAHTTTTLPSHANILVGAIPPVHGVHDNLNFRLRSEHLTLAEHLKQNGYSTAAFVGAFPLYSLYGLDQGFDVYDDDFGKTPEGKEATERRAEAVIKGALQYLERSTPPWFLWVHCYDPHDPYEPPEPFADNYGTHPYEGEVAYVDDALKSLLLYLEKNQLYKNTVIVFTGDHGESLGEHQEKTHSFFAYNSTLWVPLFIFAPWIEPQTVHENVSHIDLFPTICSLLEIEAPVDLRGRTLIDSKKRAQKNRQTIYFESLFPFYNMGWAPIRGFIQDNLKFIDSPLPELYDLDKDFDEKKNLIKNAKLSGFRKELIQILQEQESAEGAKAKQAIDRAALDKLKSLGYVGDNLGDPEMIFGPEDDVKVLLPFYNKTRDALDLLHEEQKVREGIALLQEVITATKRYPFAFVNLAEIYKEQGRLSDAIQVLRLGLEEVPQSFQIFTNLMGYLAEAGNWKDIVVIFESKFFSRFDFDPEVWNLVGTAYSNLGDFESALSCLQKAVSINESFPTSYVNLGRIYFTLFNLSTNPDSLESALLSYQKALGFDPAISAAHNGLGLIYMYKQDFLKAIFHMETALRLQPDLDSVLYNLGMAKFRIGEKAEALLYFNRFKLSPSYMLLPSSDKAKVEDLIRQCRENIPGIEPYF